MAFLDGSKGRGQAPRRGDEAKVTMYCQYWTFIRVEVHGSHGSGRLRCFDVVSAAAEEHGILVCLGGAAKSAIADEAGKGHGDRSPDHTRPKQQGGCFVVP